ncbi:MAG: homocitrate synthase, partial [Oscillospiraceae bacterium]|nr:homocitrate synthase [Oscillospiraceae bacterium]
MKERKFIVDTTLRDGEQSPHVSFDRAQKLRIFSLLEQAGVPQIEAGVPASSTYEKETILEMKKIQRRAKISVWSRLHLEDVRHCIDCEPDIIHLSIPVSYMHIYTKLKKNKAWVVGQLYACIGLLQTCGAEISAGFEDASRADMSFVIAITRILSDFNVKRIRLADTVGVMLPSTCRETVETFFAYVDKGTQLGFHAHND